MNNLSTSEWRKKFFVRYKKQLIIGQLVLVFCLGIFSHWILSDSVKRTPINETVISVPREMEKDRFWTCSMHPNIQKQVPGKCPLCGMDLIPVTFETKGKAMGGMREIVISDAARAMMNIQTTPVERRFVTAEVRMVGKVDFDETRLGYITAWISGRLDSLFVDYTGVAVNKGDHMVSIYSPELYSTQDELIQVLKYARDQEGKRSSFPDVANLIGPARERLRLWGMNKEQIQEIEKSKEPSDHLTIYSPMSGIVIQKNLQEGDYVNVGDRIYKIADLSQVWVMLDAYESDLVWLRYGQEITFTTAAYPGEDFVGRIAFIEPVLNEKTRTVKVRVNVPNLSGKLKPEMFVHGIVRTQISTGGRVVDPHLVGKWISPMHPEIVKDNPGGCDICGMPLVRAESLGYVSVDSRTKTQPLVIPVSAALVTGTRAIVYVELPDTDTPTFEGREIVLGSRAGDFYLVQNGLKEGELVVTNGNFKIDSAIQIQAKPSMMTPEGGGGGGHKHGDGEKPVKAGTGKTLAHNSIPAEFNSQLLDLESAYDGIVQAVKLKDISLIRNEFLVLEKVLSKIDTTFISDHQRMLWGEFSMLLNNDAVEGRRVKKFTDVERLFSGLTKNMRRVRDQFGISHDAKKANLSRHQEVLSVFTSHMVSLWEAYLSLQQALSGDNFSLSQEAVAHFQTSISTVDANTLIEEAHQVWEKEYSSLVQILDSMEQAENLESMRENFSPLSDVFMALVKTFDLNGFGPIYQLHCPMAFGGKGAIWLQADKQVRNPYFGAAMLTCANRVELISSGKAEEHNAQRSHSSHGLEVPKEFQSQIGKFWEAYLSLQQSLARDNFELASESINGLQTTMAEIDTSQLGEETLPIWKREHSALVTILNSMERASDLNLLRGSFSLLSDEFAVLINTFGPGGFGAVYQLHCPMVFDGRGATWLQKNRQVENPYFGSTMLKCADNIKLFSGNKVGERKEVDHYE